MASNKNATEVSVRITSESNLLHAPDETLVIQVARGNRVTSRLVFRFADGSVHDDTVVFSQRQQFRLVSDHLVQKGPTFPQPLDMRIDAASGQVTVRYVNEHGEAKVEAEHMELPPDVANGLVLTLLKNVRPGAPATVSFVAATPKPRLVKGRSSSCISAGRNGRSN